MTGELDSKIRQALKDEAAAVKLPGDLGARTLSRAGAPGGRFRRPDRVSGYPRWVYVGAAAAMIVLFFAVGTFTTREHGSPVVAYDATRTSGGTAVAPGAPGATGVAESKSAAVAGVPAPDVARPQIGVVPPSGGGSIGTFPPKIVKSADLEVRVARGRFSTAWARANQIAPKYAGFVTSSSADTIRGRLARGSIQMRVPADKLDAALADFRQLGTVVRLTTSGYDVSGQIVDVDARLRALTAQESQLLELLKQARTVSDTLEIRTRLDQVRQEIESMQGQKQLLQSQVDLSSVNATIYDPDAAPESVEPPGRLASAWDRAVENALTVVVGFLYVAGIVIPLALLGAAAWALWNVARRRRIG